MKRKSIRLFLLLLLTILQTGVFAQNNLILQLQNGTENRTPISELNTLTFTTTDLKFNFLSGSNELFPLSSVHKIVFSSISGTSQINSVTNDYQLFPNPASDYISLKNIDDNPVIIHINNITGSLIITKQLTSANNKINIQDLRDGFYILKVNNQALKFTKK